MSSSAAPPPVPPVADASKPANPGRNMSRYRRPRAGTQSSRESGPSSHPAPQLPLSSPAGPARTRADSARGTDPPNNVNGPAAGSRGPNVRAERSRTLTVSDTARDPTLAARVAARQKLTGETEQEIMAQERASQERKARAEAEQRKAMAAQAKAHTSTQERHGDRTPNPPIERERPRQEKQLSTKENTEMAILQAPSKTETGKLVSSRHARQTSVPSAKPEPAKVSPSAAASDSRKPRFNFLKKRTGDAAPEPSEMLASPTSKETKGANGQPATIKPGGGGIVPGIDAPVSAVNAGDRVSTQRRILGSSHV